jgi:hypothetical protein
MLTGGWISIRLYKDVGPVELTFWIYFYVFLALASLSQISNDYWPRPDVYSESDVYIGLLINFVAATSFVMGRMVYAFSSRKSVQNSSIVYNFGLSRTTWWLLGLSCLVFSVLVVYSSGSADLVLISRDERFASVYSLGGNSSVMGTSIYWLMRYPVLVFFLVAALLWKWRPRRHSYGLALLLLALLSWLVVIGNPINSERHWMGVFLLSSVFAIFPVFVQTFKRVIFITFVLIFLGVFVVLDAFRVQVSSSSLAYEADALVERPILTHVDFDSFQQIVNVASYVRAGNEALPSNAIYLVAFWVPRSLWDGKPGNSGALVSDIRGYENLNLSMPLPGELFLLGGWMALALLMSIYGAVVGKADSVYWKGQLSRRVVPILMVSIFSGYQIFLLRGPLFGTWPPIAAVLIYLLLHKRFTVVNGGNVAQYGAVSRKI